MMFLNLIIPASFINILFYVDDKLRVYRLDFHLLEII
jgi:hypothetical protein